MGRRGWFKMYAEELLFGKFKDLSCEDFGILSRLFCLASNNIIQGQISLTEKVPYTFEQIAGIINCDSVASLIRVINILQAEETLKVVNGIIFIENWSTYQSVYERQKPHRKTEFKQLRSEIKQRDNNTCQMCKKAETDLLVPLCLHNIDGNVENINADNLVTLCMSCQSAALKEGHFDSTGVKVKEQTERFNTIVQENGSTKSLNLEVEVEVEKEKTRSTTLGGVEFSKKVIKKPASPMSLPGSPWLHRLVSEWESLASEHKMVAELRDRGIMSGAIKLLCGPQGLNLANAYPNTQAEYDEIVNIMRAYFTCNDGPYKAAFFYKQIPRLIDLKDLPPPQQASDPYAGLAFQLADRDWYINNAERARTIETIERNYKTEDTILKRMKALGIPTRTK